MQGSAGSREPAQTILHEVKREDWAHLPFCTTGLGGEGNAEARCSSRKLLQHAAEVETTHEA